VRLLLGESVVGEVVGDTDGGTVGEVVGDTVGEPVLGESVVGDPNPVRVRAAVRVCVRAHQIRLQPPPNHSGLRVLAKLHGPL
jgi:hypothetical protein